MHGLEDRQRNSVLNIRVHIPGKGVAEDYLRGTLVLPNLEQENLAEGEVQVLLRDIVLGYSGLANGLIQMIL